MREAAASGRDTQNEAADVPSYQDDVRAAHDAFRAHDFALSARMWNQAAAHAPDHLARIFRDNANAVQGSQQ